LDRVALRRQDVCAAQAARDALHAKGNDGSLIALIERE
jgi:hypothetical protein